MYETIIRLGHGLMRNGSSPVIDVPVDGDFFLDVIDKFGISREDLRKIKPSYEDLLDIYLELKYFGFSTKYYLKQKLSRA
jgi:hypothetical protein